MPGDDRALEAERVDEGLEVAGDFGEGVGAGLVAEPVGAAVGRERVEALGEQRGSEVRDAAGGGETVEEEEWASGAAPVEVVEANGGGEGEVGVFRCHAGSLQRRREGEALSAKQRYRI